MLAVIFFKSNVIKLSTNAHMVQGNEMFKHKRTLLSSKYSQRRIKDSTRGRQAQTEKTRGERERWKGVDDSLPPGYSLFGIRQEVHSEHQTWSCSQCCLILLKQHCKNNVLFRKESHSMWLYPSVMFGYAENNTNTYSCLESLEGCWRILASNHF